MLTAVEALEYLQIRNSVITIPTLRTLNSIVLNDPAFACAPGGSEHHHNFKHGLVIHVSEVMSNVHSLTYGETSDELTTAVIWHDYMKIRDYSMDGDKIIKEPYMKLIHHVAGSAMEFHARAKYCLPQDILENIEHLLLSHHGRREWGSPVEPRTAEALILHAADMMSAQGVNL